MRLLKNNTFSNEQRILKLIQGKSNLENLGGKNGLGSRCLKEGSNSASASIKR